MKRCLTLLMAAMLMSVFALAQTGGTAKSTKVDDFGLKNSLLTEDISSKLALSADQQKKLKSENEKTTKAVDKLKEEMKKLGDHEHGADGECPHCAMAAKIKNTYTEYHKTLGKLLTNPQKEQARKLIAEREAERKRKARES